MRTLTVVLATLGAIVVVTIGKIVMLSIEAQRYLKAHPSEQGPDRGGGIAVDVVSLMTWHHALFYWLTVLLIIVLAALAYWRWA